MRKNITIGDEVVAFDCNAITSILYKQEFGKDFFGEMLRFSKTATVVADPEKASDKDLEALDIDIITRIAWACAKTADESIDGYLDWLKKHAEFNITDDGMVIFDIVMHNFDTKKK